MVGSCVTSGAVRAPLIRCDMPSRTGKADHTPGFTRERPSLASRTRCLSGLRLEGSCCANSAMCASLFWSRGASRTRLAYRTAGFTRERPGLTCRASFLSGFRLGSPCYTGGAIRASLVCGDRSSSARGTDSTSGITRERPSLAGRTSDLSGFVLVRSRCASGALCASLFWLDSPCSTRGTRCTSRFTRESPGFTRAALCNTAPGREGAWFALHTGVIVDRGDVLTGLAYRLSEDY